MADRFIAGRPKRSDNIMDFGLPDLWIPSGVFGDGTHESTTLCLDWLKQRQHKGSLIDYGSGSGILSVAAIQYGASPVQAVDTDAMAIKATARNCPEAIITDRPEPADVLIANIGHDAVLIRDQLLPLVRKVLVIGGMAKQQLDDLFLVYYGNKINTTYRNNMYLAEVCIANKKGQPCVG